MQTFFCQTSEQTTAALFFFKPVHASGYTNVLWALCWWFRRRPTHCSWRWFFSRGRGLKPQIQTSRVAAGVKFLWFILLYWTPTREHLHALMSTPAAPILILRLNTCLFFFKARPLKSRCSSDWPALADLSSSAGVFCSVPRKRPPQPL